MGFNISDVKRTSKILPPRLVFYGVDGIGKTTFGSQSPNNVFIQSEDGEGHLRLNAFPAPECWNDVVKILTALREQEHDIQSVVWDTIDWIEPFIWAQVAKDQGESSIDEIGYNKGYLFAIEYWRQFLGGLNMLRKERNIMNILLAHTATSRFDDPQAESYDRYDLKLDKRAASIVREWADVVGFANYKVATTKQDVGFNKKIVRGIGSGMRTVQFYERPAFKAKTRFNMPQELSFDWNTFYAHLMAAMTPQAPEKALQESVDREQKEINSNPEQETEQQEKEELATV